MAPTADPDRTLALKPDVVEATNVPVLVGSGITAANLAQFSKAHGFIVGSSVKQGGVWSNDLDRDAVRALADSFAELRD